MEVGVTGLGLFPAVVIGEWAQAGRGGAQKIYDGARVYFGGIRVDAGRFAAHP